MSREAIVKTILRVHTDEEGHGLDLVVDPGGGDTITVPHYANPGDDSAPLPGDSVALAEAGTREAAVGCADTQNAGKAQPGEKRLYARDAGGAVVVEVYLQRDGSITLGNSVGGIRIKPNGEVEINGVTISTAGAVSAPGEVTVMASSAPVKVSTHLHPTGVGPSGSPTPGT